MGMSEQERQAARAAYGWETVEKDIALSTPLTVQQAGRFGRAYFQHTGIHPYDLVEMVYRWYRGGSTEERLAVTIAAAFAAGRREAAEYLATLGVGEEKHLIGLTAVGEEVVTDCSCGWSSTSRTQENVRVYAMAHLMDHLIGNPAAATDG